MRIRTVIFDIDNTLYSYEEAHRTAFGVLSGYADRILGLEPDVFARLVKEAGRTQVLHAGGPFAPIHSRLVRFQLVLERAGKPLSHARVMDALYWSVFLAGMTPFAGVPDCFPTLREAGYRIGIGTNMTADYQFAKLEKLGVLPWVDFMVSSEETVAEKPDARFFACCAEKSGGPAESCLFVGDHPMGDVQGALSAGMEAVWLCRVAAGPAELPGVARIHAPEELPDLLLAREGRVP